MPITGRWIAGKLHVQRGNGSPCKPSRWSTTASRANNFHGKILSAVISSRAGWWFVSIAVEVEHETPTHGGGTVGIDLGIKTLATLSGGEKFENQKHYRKSRGAYPGLKQGPLSQSRGESELVEEYPETGKGTLSRSVPTSGCLAQDVYAGCPNLCLDWPGRPQHERNAG